MDCVDLHLHSTFSDGTLSPAELVGEATRVGLRAIALTDHDEVRGNPEALFAAKEQGGLEVIPGVELSVEFEPEMHILGYFVDWTHPELNARLEEVRRFREERNPRILERLREMGLELDYGEVRRIAGGEVVGRVHIAQALVNRGYVRNVEEAFQRFLGRGRPAYVKRRLLPPQQAIWLIRQAGGVPCLAHPFSLCLSLERLEDVVGELRDWGLEGLEVYYHDHFPQQIRALREMAMRWDLVVTGGTDFHGAVKPGVVMGQGMHWQCMPYEAVEELRRRCAR